MLREMAEALEVLSADRSLVLWFEDLHWADYSTLDLIAYLARRSDAARLLVLGTYRPVAGPSARQLLGAVEQDLLLHGQCELLPLVSLAECAVVEYLDSRYPRHSFPSELPSLIHDRTDEPRMQAECHRPHDGLAACGLLRWETLRRDAMTQKVRDEGARRDDAESHRPAVDRDSIRCCAGDA
jgi:hypothetical protein